VSRVDVLDEPSVEHLVDAVDGRPPRADPLHRTAHEVTIVQDPRPPTALDGLGGDTEVTMNELAGLVAFAFAGSVSPGPNNAILWASGLAFGFRRSLPHVLGTAIGIGALAIGVAAGIGALFEAVPSAELILKLAGSAYLLFVAYRVLGSTGIGPTEVSRPFTLRQAIGFQCVNPKAWVFAVAAVSTFLPHGLPAMVAIGALTGVVMAVVVASSSIWAIGGAALGRIVDDDRSRRVVGIVLAVLLVASVALIWL
jgi:threonine/homoserine/homoserine lactone efflux protein